MIKIGVYVCSCDGSYKDSLDLERIVEYARNLPDVAKVTSHDHFCKNDGLELIKEDIKNHEIERVVMAGCTPINYERFIASELAESGLNRYLYEQANIREHSAWIHREKETATDMAKSIISMAVAKSRFSEPLNDLKIDIIPNALVIGGGVAGMRAALDLGNKGYHTYLVERESQLGGRTWHLNRTYPTANCGICCMHNCKSCRLTPEQEEIYSNRNIEVITDTQIADIKGHIGNYKVNLKEKDDNQRSIDVGTIIIATGSKTFDPNRVPEYGYENDNVVTFLELEQLKGYRRPSDGTIPKVVNFILCVGSRSEKNGNPHCSLVCCNYAIGQAKEIKTLYPDSEVYIHYIDIRAAYRGFEEFYAEARNMGITFLRGRVARVEKVGDKLLVRAKDLDVGRLLKIESDLVVLAVGQEPSIGTNTLAKMTHQKLGADGFIKDVNPQYRSMEETGVYVAGCAQGPKGVRYSVEDAKIAAASAVELLSKGKILLSPIRSHVNETICAGCGTCAELCVYDAIEMVQDHNSLGKKVSFVDEASCRGCGICIAACSSGAMEQKGFQNKQINSMINAFLEPKEAGSNSRIRI